VNLRTLAGATVVALTLVGCATGPRPRLVDDTTNTPLINENAQGVVDALSTASRSPFTVAYDIVTKFGGLETKALVTGDATHGTAIVIASVKYVYLPDGQSFTCDTNSNTCGVGIDETRISDRQLTSRFFKDSVISRIRQDARTAAGEITFAIQDVAGTSALCLGVPVIDGNGAIQTKSYCAYSTLGMLASMETADLSVTATSVATWRTTARS
jgi:hypothetical protein